MIWTLLWMLWIFLFFAFEIPALVNKTPGDTLSEHIWKWFAVKDGSGGWVQLRRVTLVAGLAWLVMHFLTGGWA